jgi:hypothetical protein
MFNDTRRIAKKPSTRTLNAQRRQIERAYYRLASGIQISILDITHIFDAGHAAIDAGTDLDAALAAAIQQYRKN